jgi:hypothetical protein
MNRRLTPIIASRHADWDLDRRDDLFTKNLGFVEDPPMMESMDFGYGFDFLPEQ